MKDDNIRRLLHYSITERQRGYERELQQSGKSPKEEKLIRHYSILPQPNNEMLVDMTQNSLSRLGVNVIWIRSFDEIPEGLKGVYSDQKFNWSDVF